MKQIDPSHFQSSRTAWQAVGQVRLPANREDRLEARSLLEEKLDPLQLPVEFLHRIETSVLQILERADRREPRFEHVHLFLFLPAGPRTNSGSWGFFRIERIDAAGTEACSRHAVDLYLYPDGI